MNGFPKRLSKQEKAHLFDVGITTFDEFKRNAAKQKEMRDEADSIEPCWECRRIAWKLGLPI